MRYYTKEWNELLKKTNYLCGVQKIPDKEYSDEEIQAFYDADLAEEIENDERIHNSPPDYSVYEELLKPDTFEPENFLLEEEETGELFHPESIEVAREYIEKERKEQEEQFANRPPFDPLETIACFKDSYRVQLRYAHLNFPQWVCDSVDKRLLALDRMPETVYERLRKEEEESKKAFDEIMSEAKRVLSAQDVPERIKSQLCFHDADVLALKKKRSDMELFLNNACWCDDKESPYVKMIFKNVSTIEREKGFALRIKRGTYGELESSCTYLYDELYRTENGYELHLLLYTTKALRYLTISCEDIVFVDNIEIEDVVQELGIKK